MTSQFDCKYTNNPNITNNNVKIRKSISLKYVRIRKFTTLKYVRIRKS